MIDYQSTVSNLKNLNPECGFYSLTIIEENFPNIKIINACEWRRYGSGRHGNTNYDWLCGKINNFLNNNKTVLVIPEDEEVMYPLSSEFVSTLNKYISNSVYFVTQMYDFGIYRQGGIKCKMLELPWMMLNDCMCYHAIEGQFTKRKKQNNNLNYISFTGRLERHKIQLLETLCNENLDSYGLLTVMSSDEISALPNSIKHKVNVNEIPPYTKYNAYNKNKTSHQLYDDITGFKEGGFINIDDIWVSENVINFLKIREFYNEVPLVIHSETVPGIFPITEKSIWPILLGKIFLIHGRWQLMAELQRFYDVDVSKIINADFDNIDGWDIKDHNRRLEKMIISNKELIKNPLKIYNNFKNDIERSKYSIGENLYNFFIQQLVSVE